MAAIKLVELIYLRDHPNDAGYQRIMAFLDIAPNWPLSEALLKRAERSLYVNNESPELILRHFDKRKPVDRRGLAGAGPRPARHRRHGGRARPGPEGVGRSRASRRTREVQVSPEFGKLLTVDDHKRRMWRLVYAQETNAAIRAAKRLPAEYQKAAAVAQKLMRGEKGADKHYAGLPSDMRQYAGHALCAGPLLPHQRELRQGARRAARRSGRCRQDGRCRGLVDRAPHRGAPLDRPRRSEGARARPPTRLPPPTASPRATRRSKASSSPAGSRCAT